MAQLKGTTVNGNLAVTNKGELCISGDTSTTHNADKAIAVYSTNSATNGTEPIFAVGNATGVTDIAGKLTCAGACQVDGNFYAKGTVADSTFTVNTPATFNKTTTFNKTANFKNQVEIHSSSSDKAPYIDFHYNGATTDYSARILCPSEGMLDLIGSGTYSTLRIDTNGGYIYPTVQGNFALGKTDRRFATIYTTVAVNVSSFAELKEDIKPFTSALEEIDKTDVYNYKLKECIKRYGSDSDHTGFIIGEGYNLSEYILAHDKDGIDLYNAIGVAFGGVKELHEKVKIQENKITELENENKEMKEEIALLKAHLGL